MFRFEKPSVAIASALWACEHFKRCGAVHHAERLENTFHRLCARTQEKCLQERMEAIAARKEGRREQPITAGEDRSHAVERDTGGDTTKSCVISEISITRSNDRTSDEADATEHHCGDGLSHTQHTPSNEPATGSDIAEPSHSTKNSATDSDTTEWSADESHRGRFRRPQWPPQQSGSYDQIGILPEGLHHEPKAVLDDGVVDGGIKNLTTEANAVLQRQYPPVFSDTSSDEVKSDGGVKDHHLTSKEHADEQCEFALSDTSSDEETGGGVVLSPADYGG